MTEDMPEQPDGERVQCPETKANFISRTFLLWVFPIVLKGWRNPLQDKDLWELPDKERGSSATSQLQTIIAADPQREDGEINVVKNIIKAYRRALIISGILKGITVIISLLNPILLNRLIRFITLYRGDSASRPPLSQGIGWAFALLILPVIFAIAENQYFLLGMRSGMKVRSALQGIIYDKSLTMSPSARAGSSLGEIVNLMQLDTQRISDFAQIVHLVWSTPIQLLVTCILLFYFIRWSAVVGIVATLATIPIQAKLMAVLARLRKAAVVITDQRVKLVNEILQGIKAVKFYAWETPFSKKIEEKRDEEMENFGKTVWANSIFFSLFISIPILIAVVTFSFYAGVSKKVLEPATVFTAVTLLNILRGPLLMLPRVVTYVNFALVHKSILILTDSCFYRGWIDTKLGFTRIEAFLKAEDTDDYSRGGENSSASSSDAPHIIIENGTFKWGEPGTALADQNETETKKSRFPSFFNKKKPEVKLPVEDDTEDTKTDTEKSKRNTLEEINVTMKSGKLTGVVGRVGSGKSSLVSAILGEMQKIEGEVSLNGTVAYVAQTAWIFNDTLKNNILFGKEYDEKLYKKAVKVSALEHDIEVLPAGDLTSIGEKGINLSGGQKQRVSIARAVYADRDVYIFDDPLSALDAHVSQKVFDDCISNKGALKDRLRLLITNQVHVLPNCDNIVLLEDGRIRNQGTYNKLASEDSAFQEIVNDLTSKEKENEKENKTTTDPNAVGDEAEDADETVDKSISIAENDHTEETRKEGQKLIKAEDREVGNIKLDSYRKYAVACGGAVVFSLILIFWVLVVALGIYSTYWLAYWADQETRVLETGVHGRGLSFYIGIYFLLGFGYAILLCLRSVVFLKMALRASKTFHSDALSSLMKAPMSFFDTTPIGRILSRFSRDVGAVDLVLPQVFSQMLTTVFQLIGSYILIASVLPPFLGAAFPITIGYWFLQRFFNRTSLEVKRLDSISKSPIYAHFSETLSGLSTIRAYKKQEEAIGENRGMIDINTRAYFTFIATSRWFSLYLELLGSTLIFFTALFAVLVPAGATASELGLSLSYVLQVTGILGFTIRSITEVESQMSSVERLEHYSNNLPQEADHENERPDENWPEKGEIEIEDASLRYREGLELVLKGVAVKINPGEKVGVIGRTGSGKSTLMVAILRLVELAGGSIKVDNVNIEKLGLHHVRKSITIIPQDPVLFSGTIRFNLDPFDIHSDVELWDALEKSSMKRFVEEFDSGLDSFVSEYGENLSAGQRQLMCLSRALLRKSKILILDEASSSLDAETDRFIQESIRNHMNDATILTIAHRLSTLADYDRIMVMESGSVAEYGTPSELLEDKNTKLTGFVDSLGKHGADQFREIVRNNR